jgi:anti-sigma factor RsiW
MRFQVCAAINPLLESYHDGELTIEQQIAVAAHLDECSYCAGEVEALRYVRGMLRDDPGESGGRPSDQALGELMRNVISRVKAERYESFPARVARMFEDLHLVWAGLAAATATATCAASVAAVLAFAPAWRADSLAGVLSALASPGSDRNPVRTDEGVALPWLKSEDVMPAVAAALPDTADVGVSLAVAGVLTQEGRVSNASLLPPARYDVDVTDARRVIDAVTLARFQPAQRGGLPVAVSLIWVLEQTTVKGKTSS